MLLAVVLVVAACGPETPPLDQKVDAANLAVFQQWRVRASEYLRSNEMQALDTAAKELRLSLMGEGISGTDALDAAFRARVDGKPVRQLIRLGYSAKIQRLRRQEEEIDAILAQNAQLVTQPGDTASADYLARLRDQQRARREAVQRDIDQSLEEMKAMGITVEPSEPSGSRPAAPLSTGSAPRPGSPIVEPNPDTMPCYTYRCSRPEISSMRTEPRGESRR